MCWKSPPPQAVLDEDKLIEIYTLDIKPENVHIISINEALEK